MRFRDRAHAASSSAAIILTCWTSCFLFDPDLSSSLFNFRSFRCRYFLISSRISSPRASSVRTPTSKQCSWPPSPRSRRLPPRGRSGRRLLQHPSTPNDPPLPRARAVSRGMGASMRRGGRLERRLASGGGRWVFNSVVSILQRSDFTVHRHAPRTRAGAISIQSAIRSPYKSRYACGPGAKCARADRPPRTRPRSAPSG